MKHTRTIVAASAVALGLVPFFAGAMSTADIQAQIQALLSQIATLQQKIGDLAPVTTTPVTTFTPITDSASVPTSAATPISGTVCPVFNYTLSRGSRGPAVEALQKFLVTQGYLTADSATSFYGALTEAAVQNFQTQQDIVSSGTPATTGWGVVGKNTSGAIVRVCSSSFKTPAVTTDQSNAAACTAIALTCPAGKHDQVGANCSHTCVATIVTSCRAYPPPISDCATGWKANVDANGCTLSYSCTTTTTQTSGNSYSYSNCPYYSTPGCVGATALQWLGNDSRGCSLGYQCVPTTASCTNISCAAGYHSSGPVCSTSQTCVPDTTTTLITFSATPFSGTPPLTVTFNSNAGTSSTSVNFGDGTTGLLGSHTYAVSGTYTANLNGIPTNGGIPALYGTVTITVN